jgi:rare lipoprotein A (peptidoglycan hydrolase)
VTLRYGSHQVTVPVIDRGPYSGNREYDLTQATKERLGFGSTGTVLTNR